MFTYGICGQCLVVVPQRVENALNLVPVLYRDIGQLKRIDDLIGIFRGVVVELPYDAAQLRIIVSNLLPATILKIYNYFLHFVVMYWTDQACVLSKGTRENDDAEKDAVTFVWDVVDDENVFLPHAGGIDIMFQNFQAKAMDSSAVIIGYTIYDQISAALALYRCVSLFKCGLNPKRADFYKTNWSIVLRHRRTHALLELGDYKGGFGIHTPYSSLRTADMEYVQDVEALCTLLAKPTMTGNYDGTVAGHVA